MKLRWRRDGIQIKRAFRANLIICPWCGETQKYETESRKLVKEGTLDWVFFTCNDCNKKFKTFRWKNVFYNKRINKF